MPGYDPYQNPSNMPYIGNYVWEPRPTAGLGGSLPGPSFTNLVLERGSFRNDAPVNGNLGSIEFLEPGGQVEKDDPDAKTEEYPVLRAYRPVSDPFSYTGPIPDLPFITSGAEASWGITIPNNSQRTSCATIYYRLTVDPLDESIDAYLDEEDLAKVQAYRDDPQTAPFPDVEFPKYALGRLTVATEIDGDEEEYPTPADDTPVEMKLTGFVGRLGDVRKLTVKFTSEQENLPESYQPQKQLKITNRFAIPSLRLELHKVMLFDADRVNISYDQTPFALMEYAYLVDFEFDPIRGTALWPNSGSEPNYHLKLFVPDENVAATGFAHSIYLKFLIFSAPTFGIAPGDFSLGGLLNDMQNPSAFLVSFIGPRPGRRNALYTSTARANTTPGGRLVALDTEDVKPDTLQIVVEKYAGPVSAGPPSSGAAFQQVYVYDLENPPDYSEDGPMLSPYLYLDLTDGENVARSTDWFRTRQRLQSGTEVASPPFRSMVWSEKTTFKMLAGPSLANNEPREYVVRRAQLAEELPNADPLRATAAAIFVADDERTFEGSQEFAPGAWRFRLRAQMLDEETLTNTHLFIRMWLVPADTPSGADHATLESYRPDTELSFVSAQGSTGGSQSLLKMGAPANLSEVMISPPLDSALREVELVRYVEGLVGGSSRLTLPPGSWKLVAGAYPVSLLTPDGEASPPKVDARECPRFTIEIDPAYGTVETTLLISQSHAIFPVRWLRYNTSRYQPYGGPGDEYAALTATRSTVGGGLLSGDDEFLKYEEKVADFDADADTDAYSGLSSLRAGEFEEGANLCIPFKQIPNTKGDEGRVYADFCADEHSMSAGRISNRRVLSGGATEVATWRVEWSVDEDVDLEAVALDMRAEVMLVDRTGRITERVMRSPKVPFEKGVANYSAEVTIEVPFTLSPSEGLRAVVRMSAYPYSADGSPVDSDDLEAALGDKPLGLRLTELKLAEHSMETLEFEQVASLLGSPAFYENLDLVPSRTIGGDEFWYIAAEENLRINIIIRPATFRIQGTMYSPVWFLNMPKDVEAIVRAPSLNSGAFTRQLWVRTVPVEEGEDPEVPAPALGAAHHARSEQNHVVFNEKGEMEDGEERGTHIVTHSPERASPNTASVIRDARGNKMQGTEPSTFRTRGGGGDKSGEFVAVTAQFNEPDGAAVSSAASARHARPESFRNPSVAMQTSQLDVLSRVASGLSYHSSASGRDGDRCYVAGFSQPGTVLMRETSLLQAQAARDGGIGSLYLVDGDADPELPYDQVPIMPLGGTNGRAAEGYPGVFVGADGEPVVVYCLEGGSGLLYARRREPGRGFGRAHLVASTRQGGAANSEELQFFGPAGTHLPHYDAAMLFFWCGGKVFTTRYAPIHGSQTILQPMYLVAGNSDFELNTNSANGTFLQLASTGHLHSMRSGSEEEDVPQQRVGVAVMQSAGQYSTVAVYYENASGDVMCRYVKPNGRVGQAFKVHGTV